MKNILKFIGKNRKIISFIVLAITFISIILFEKFYPSQDFVSESKESSKVLENTISQSDLDKDKFYKDLVSEVINISAESDKTIYSSMDFSNYYKFLSTPNSNPEWILGEEIRVKRNTAKNFDKNKDSIRIISRDEKEDLIILDYLWNEEKGVFYFQKNKNEFNDIWQCVPYGIKKVIPISKAVVFSGYLPLKITGNVADIIDGGKRVFLMFGNMGTKLIKMPEKYPLFVKAILANGTEDEIVIEKEDLKRYSKKSFVSDKPIFMNLYFPNASAEIIGLEFRNLKFEHNVEGFEGKNNLENISIKLYY